MNEPNRLQLIVAAVSQEDEIKKYDFPVQEDGTRYLGVGGPSFRSSKEGYKSDQAPPSKIDYPFLISITFVMGRSLTVTL